jgi:hypothetical protein
MNKLVKAAFLGLIAQSMATVSVDIDGTTFESYGLVGFGKIPSDSVDKFKETMAPGSSMEIDQSSVQVDGDGTYHFTVYGLPDRGMNVDGTVNTFSRVQKFDVAFTPKNESSTDNIIWTYEDTILLKDFKGQYISGLDSNTTVEYNGQQIPAVTYQGDGWSIPSANASSTTMISLDSEAITLIGGSAANGFWISDEYGPSLFKFDSTGNMIDYIEAPQANIPHVDGEVLFSSDDSLWTDPEYSVKENENGRTSNHGYEGMDISPDGKYLFTMLQSATIQDGGEKSKNRMNTRLLKYDITVCPPQLVGEYVVVLPTYTEDGKDKTASQSEMRVLSEDLVLVLPRDSDLGRGGADGTQSLFKHVDFYSLKNADNIVGQYDGVGQQIASTKGDLNSNITPASHYSFIDMIDPAELAKFGIHNGGADDSTLINEKWESMSLVPVKCTTDEYYLLLGSDNDYKTTNGFLDFGKIQYDSGIDVDTQSFMYHIKLPIVPHNQGCDVSSSTTSLSSSSTVPFSEPSSSAAPPMSSAIATSLNPAGSSSVNTTDANTNTNTNASSTVEAASTSTALSTTVFTEPCEKCTESSTSYTTYTTVTNGSTVTVTEPCTTSPVETNSNEASYITYTTVTNGVTVIVTEPCTTTETDSTSFSITTTAPNTTAATTTAPAVAPTTFNSIVSDLPSFNESVVTSAYEGAAVALNANAYFLPAIAAAAGFAALM